MMWAAIAILALLGWAALLTFVVSACIVAGNADDAADQALHDLTNGNSFPSVLTPPEDASPGASTPHTARAGGSLDHSFHETEIARG